MRIERHVFGSVRGYTTLARSAGVSKEEAKRLEADSFAFGQTSDAGFIASLARSPAYFTRNSDGRRGVTRVFDGGADDNGRPTLRMVTLLIARQSWDGELYGDVGQLLRRAELWQWDGAATGQIAALDVAAAGPMRTVPPGSGARVLALLAEIERAVSAGANEGVVVSADGLSLAEMTAVEMLIPPAARGWVTTAYRSLSAGLAVSLNALAAEASRRGVNFALDGAPDFSGSPYAAHLSATQLVGAGVLPLAEAVGYATFGMAAPAISRVASTAAAPAGPARAPVVTTRRRRRRPFNTIAAVVAALLVIGVGAVVYFRGGAEPKKAIVDGGGPVEAATSRAATSLAATTRAASEPVKVMQPTTGTTRPATSRRTTGPATTLPIGQDGNRVP